jgi:hypothetical protein
MYCEVVVKHRSVITEAGLEEAVCKGQLGVAIPLAVAYGRSAFYRLVAPPHSVGAFETVRRCFVIVREVNSRFSTYHLEGNLPTVSVQQLLAAVQDFASLLSPVLRRSPGGRDYANSSLTVQLFEDNDGRETGVEGRLTTLTSVLRERFSWTSLRSGVIAFTTGGLLIWLGLNQEKVTATVYSFAIVVLFTVLESTTAYFMGRGKIKWKLRQG